jgi:hypothetical protein
LVGASRFELETSCAQGRRATRLRYAPTGNRAFILTQFGKYANPDLRIPNSDLSRGFVSRG